VNIPSTNSSHNLQFLTANSAGQGTFYGLGFGVSTPQNPEKSLAIGAALGSTTTTGYSIIILPASVSSFLIASFALSFSFNYSQVIHDEPFGQ
jgi:hypothetical protein